jgi:hypothetical protein
LREFVELLNSNGVEYLVVGAFAVAHHGYPRYTGDLDLLIRPSAENAARVLRTLSEFGFGVLDVVSSDLHYEGKVVQLGVPPHRINLIKSLSGVSFDEAWASREDGEFGGVPARFIGRDALLKNKESTGRAKDLGDAEELRKRRLG